MSVYNEASMYNGQDPVDTEVHHDSTLSGDGSSADPLSVNFPATNVAHDSTLSGDGSSADPLSVNYAKVRYVTTSNTYTQIRNIIESGYQPILEVVNGSYHGYLVCTHKSGTHIDFIGNIQSLVEINDGTKGITLVSVDNNSQWTLSKLLPTCYNYTGLAGKFLRVNNAETEPSWEDLIHDSTLVGDGTSSNPLSVSTSSTVNSGDTTHFPTADAVYNFVNPLSVKKIHSFYVDTQGYYKLARIVFPDNMASYGGVLLAVTWRSVYAQSGSGILSISFAENGISTVWGRVLITSSRGVDHLKDELVFSARRLSALEYEILCYSKDFQMISFSLLSGNVSVFEAVDSATVTSGTNIQVLRYSVPTVTDYFPT